jgi:hypothetical protein
VFFSIRVRNAANSSSGVILMLTASTKHERGRQPMALPPLSEGAGEENVGELVYVDTAAVGVEQMTDLGERLLAVCLCEAMGVPRLLDRSAHPRGDRSERTAQGNSSGLMSIEWVLLNLIA